MTLGEGHDASWWQRFCAALDGIGYRGVLSIEHEDARVKPVDGVRTTVDLLRRIAPTG